MEIKQTSKKINLYFTFLSFVRNKLEFIEINPVYVFGVMASNIHIA